MKKACEDVLPLGLLGSPLPVVAATVYLVGAFPQSPAERPDLTEKLPSLGSQISLEISEKFKNRLPHRRKEVLRDH